MDFHGFDLILYDQLQWICVYLKVKDQSALACTSKHLHELVCMYWENRCKKCHFEESLNLFFNNNVLFNTEEYLRNVLDSGEYSSRWLYIQGATFTKLRRILVKDISNFPHKGINMYIPVEYDKTLKREIVRLKEVCWLYFSEHFDNVFVGDYEVILRMKLVNVYFPPSKDPTMISCTWKDPRGSHSITVEVRPNQWVRLERDLMKYSEELINCKISDVNNGWFSLAMGPIRITERCNVYFTFSDIVNCGWKSGMSWDYLELQPI